MGDKRTLRSTQHRILILELIGDFGAIAVAMMLAYALRFKTFLVNYGNADPHQQIEPYFPLLGIAIWFFMCTFAYLGMYSNRRILHLHRNISSIVKGSTFWLLLFLSFSLAIKFEPQVSRVFVAFSYVSVILILIIWRWVLHKILILSPWLENLQQRIIVFGTNDTAVEISKSVNGDENLSYLVCGYVGDASSELSESGNLHLQHLGKRGRFSSNTGRSACGHSCRNRS